MVTLHLEEIRFHEAHTPHSRVVPAIEPAFRQRLARVWRGERVEEGAPLLLVAEQAGQVIGFTENWLSETRVLGLPTAVTPTSTAWGWRKGRGGWESAVC